LSEGGRGRRAGTGIGTYRAGVGDGGGIEELDDVGRADGSLQGGTQAQVLHRRVLQAHLVRVDAAGRGRVIRAPVTAVEHQVLGSRQVRQQRDARFGEYLVDVVSAVDGR